MVAGISNVAALLKALSPAGKRLTPMLAICVQGILFALGLGIFGINSVGVLIGMLLLCLWAFAQPLILAYLIFGSAFFSGAQKLWIETAHSLGISQSVGPYLLLGIVGIKLLFGALVSFIAWRSQSKFEEKYLRRINSLGLKMGTLKKPVTSGAEKKWKLILSDLLNPYFIFSLSLSMGFLYLSRHDSLISIGIYFLRTLAFAWLVFFAIRSTPRKWIKSLERRFPPLGVALSRISESKGV